jgi:hypothetical protein
MMPTLMGLPCDIKHLLACCVVCVARYRDACAMALNRQLESCPAVIINQPGAGLLDPPQ